MVRRAFITGITGQDGSYLAELLLAKGYEVHGLIRRSSSFNTWRIDHLYVDPHDPQARLFLHYGDLRESARLVSLLEQVRPDEVYNLAAQSHVRVSFDEPEHTADTTGTGSVRLLEAIRLAKLEPRYYRASSSEMFGATPPPQSESTPFAPRSPYGASKLFSFWMTRNYREAYGLFAVNGILFNHESPRRGNTFVTRKITRAVARISAGLDAQVYLGNIDAVRDWGLRPEYVEGMWRMLQADEPEDFVLATGIGHSVRDFLEAAFSYAGLDWREHVRFDERYLRPTEVDALVGDATMARVELGWSPTVDALALARIMVDADREVLAHEGTPWIDTTAGDLGAKVTELDRDAVFYVAGHRGLVGSAVWRALTAAGFRRLVGRSSAELDLRDRAATSAFLAETRPRYLVLAAARVGGILANASHPVEFLSDNLRIQTNVLDAALESEVERVLFLASSCVYPRLAPQPIPESALLTGALEPTNDAYAIAKIAGILHVQAMRREYGRRWISAMPTNLYGPGDNFSVTGAHVLPALIRRYSEAVETGAPLVVNWGSGTPRREFLHVDDAASACLHLLEHYDDDAPINVGTGSDVTIRELAETISRLVGYAGRTEWDETRPDGTPQKRLDISRIAATGWVPRYRLDDGLQATIEWFRENRQRLRD